MLDLIRLLVDFGLVVLIWLVQLVIYPGFRHCSAEGLARWHTPYTARVAWIVAPLMFVQLGLVALELSQDMRVTQWVVASLLAVAWGATFFHSVPCHAKIGSGRGAFEAVESLIRGNWLRTISWSAVFLIDFFDLQAVAR